MRTRLLTGLLALTLTTPLLAAPPDHAKNKGNGNGGGNAHEFHDKGGRGHVDPILDLGGIRGLLHDNRSFYSPGKALPPGVAKNLARGKPLPPGIAKRLDSRLLGRLPHYDGYEWMQAGRDLILVTAATGVIYEVLRDALD